MQSSKHLKEKNTAAPEPLSDEQRIARRRKRTRRRLIAALMLTAAAIAALALLPDAAETDGSIIAEESVLSAEALLGDIDTVFCGSGSLSDDTALEVTIPASVELLGYTVKNGQSVSEGEVIAIVDPSDALSAAAELQTSIDELDGDIATAASDNISSVISAHSDGRVKAVYAGKYVPVLDTMYEHGALILVSLDGLMALDIPGDGLVPGQRVTVTLSDGSTQSGAVAQIDEGVATVTTDDEKAGYGERVTVSDLNGGALGEGTLYIHSEQKITGFSGTAHDVYVTENQYIYAKQGLIALVDTEYEGNYKSLMKTRAEYAEQMEKLLRMSREGYVRAEYDGIVTGIEEGAEYLPLSAVASAPASSLAAHGSGSGRVVLLSAETATAASEPTATVTKYVGKVSSVSYSSISLNLFPNPVTMDAGGLGSVDESALTFAQQFAPDDSAVVYVYDNGTVSQGSLASIASGDMVLLTFVGTTLSQIDCLHVAQTPGSTGQGGAQQDGSQKSGGTAVAGGSAAQTETESGEETEPADTVLCSLIPREKMLLVISVDELDILSLSVGQRAQVTLDAVSGQSFDAVVTELDPIGVNDGGSTKYSLTLTLERTELMLNGMNASTRITVASAENALLIPEAALYEDGSRVFVYTGYDKKTDTLTGPVTVTTGVSDGTNVQITGGLEQGATVYYKFADSLVYSK